MPRDTKVKQIQTKNEAAYVNCESNYHLIKSAIQSSF